jgi:hypothetical protein
MGEHNTEDARSPVPPRRGARPFVGPAGAPGQPLPLLRATPTRPAPRPFVPAPGARPSLGTTPRPVPPAAPIAASPVAAPDAPPPVPVLEAPRAADLRPTSELPLPDIAPPPTAPTTPVAATPVWLAAQTPLPPTPDTFVPPPVDEPPPDRFAAFDATWPAEPVVEATAAPATGAPLLDVASLGAGHTDEVWAGDIVSDVPPVAPTESAVPAWLMDDADPVPIVHVTGAASEGSAGDLASVEPELVGSESDAAIDASMLDASWTDATVMPSADAIMAGGLEAKDASVVDDDPSASWPDPLLAEYAPYLPTPTTLAPVKPSPPVAAATTESAPDSAPLPTAQTEPAGAAAVRPASPIPAVEPAVESVVAESVVVESAVVESVVAHSTHTATESVVTESAPTGDVVPSHASLVAASLDRLAERVRDGQIDVSSVAPEGPDAAVLAAVLAALLGGGQSRSR